MAQAAPTRLPARLPGAVSLAHVPALRQVLALLGIAAAVAIGTVVALWSRSPAYTVLYAGLEERDASRIVQAMQAAGDRYQLGPGGTSILVPEGEVASLRMKLAAQGLPQGGQDAADEEEEASAFGVSDFAEKARYQKRLETDLARSIASLQPVKAARVHLAMSKSSAFIRDRRPASASVVVTLFPGRRLDAAQVSAIVNLVASSVAEMDPHQVSVIDQQGDLLTAAGSADAMAAADERFKLVQRVEQGYAGRIVELLTPLIGPGRVRAQVVADLDFTETERASERFDPEARVLRSEQVSNQERRGGQSAAQGIPGALSNQPPATPPQPTAAEPVAEAAAADAAGPGMPEAQPPAEVNSSATRNFEVDRTISRIRKPTGTIRRLTVAVVVDNKLAENEDGELEAVALSQTELAQMTELVRNAVGFDQARGDSVSVLNVAFQSPQEVEPPPASPLWERPAVREIAKQVIGAAVLLVLILSVLRPLLRGLVSPPPREPGQVLIGASSVNEIAGPAGAERGGAAERTLAFPPVGFEEKVTLAKRMVSQNPRQVAQVVKNWVGEDGS